MGGAPKLVCGVGWFGGGAVGGAPKSTVLLGSILGRCLFVHLLGRVLFCCQPPHLHHHTTPIVFFHVFQRTPL